MKHIRLPIPSTVNTNSSYNIEEKDLFNKNIECHYMAYRKIIYPNQVMGKSGQKDKLTFTPEQMIVLVCPKAPCNSNCKPIFIHITAHSRKYQNEV